MTFAGIPAARVMLTKLMFAPVRVHEKEEEILCYLFYLAKRAVSVDGGVSISVVRFIKAVYEVSEGYI